MSTENIKNLSSNDLMKLVLQRIATGPELSKNISREEAKLCMDAILNDEIEEVRAAIFLIALRMKRETHDENLGVHDSILASTKNLKVSVDHLINVADPYDGFTRNIPSSVFLLPVLAELGYPSFSHGVKCVGPKFGCTHNIILQLLGLDVNMSNEQAAERLENKDIGWTYVDQSKFCPSLYNMMDLRTKIIKRPIITTIEVLAKPLTAKKNHFVTGYVHKPYPPIYLMLARNAGFETAMTIRGTEGGVIPSLTQTGKIFSYKNIESDNQSIEFDPKKDLGINQEVRAVQIPEDINKSKTIDKVQSKIDPFDVAKEAVKLGLDALSDKDGAMKDCIIYGSSIILQHITNDDIHVCVKAVKEVLKTKSASNRLKK